MDTTTETNPRSGAASGDPLGFVVAVEGWRLTGLVDGAQKRSTGNSEPLSFGSLVKVDTGRSVVYGVVSRVWFDDAVQSSPDAHSRIEVELVGEVERQNEFGRDGFQRGVKSYPELGARILMADAEDVAKIYAKPQASNITVGTIHHGGGQQPAYLMTDNLLGKHFALLGSSGTGKSCSVALMLHEVLNAHPHGHIVMLDPHDEYGAAFEGRAEVVAADALLLPYWLMNFEEALATFASRQGVERDIEARILKEVILEARREYATHHGIEGTVTVDSPIPYYLRDVQHAIDMRMGKLDKPDGAAPYLRLLARIEALLADNRFAFMFPDGPVADTMPEILARLFRVPASGKPMTIVDLSGIPSEIVDVVVSMVCRMIFDFCVWNVEQHRIPILLVCEEAHRYVPRDESTSFAPTRRAISRIAKEGRKYGVGLCLVSQRPSELSETTLSQCSTIISLRMSNHNDQEFVARTMPDGMGGLVRSLPALHTQEAVAVGEAVSIPTRLRFNDLEPARRPRSGTAPFAKAWNEDLADDSLVRGTIDHWRKQK